MEKHKHIWSVHHAEKVGRSGYEMVLRCSRCNTRRALPRKGTTLHTKVFEEPTIHVKFAKTGSIQETVPKQPAYPTYN